MSQTAVDIPVDWLATQPQLPDRCARHGLPAVKRVDFAVKSRPKVSPKSKVLLPGYTSLNRADEYLKQLTITKVEGWPMCARCVRERTVGLVLAGVLFFGGLVAMVAAFVAGAVMTGTRPLLAVPILAGLALVLVSPLALRHGSLPWLTQTQTTDDGTAVRVIDPHPQFTAELPQQRQ
jgi:hypothetical protein